MDCRDGSTVFGVRMEGQGISHIQFANGVRGLMLTGKSATGLVNRLEGTEGVIEVGYSDTIPLRVRGRGDTAWRTVEPGEGIHGPGYVERGVLDLIEALKTGREPELSGRRALQATELIFATYESSRKRGRVDLPLTIEDSPLLAMLEAGELGLD